MAVEEIGDDLPSDAASPVEADLGPALGREPQREGSRYRIGPLKHGAELVARLLV